MKGTPASVETRFKSELARGSHIFISSIAASELWYGAFKSQRQTSNRRALEEFLIPPLRTLSFDDEDAIVAGRIRAELHAGGKPIGGYDLLIASQALRQHLTVVTANVSEFSRVKGLKWVDWARTQ